MAAKINLLKSGKSVNTKTVILIKANELINEVGISDFRVDTLATSLGLSPGNITYHFHRKDDIAFALWNLAIDSVKKTYMHYVSSILDITQLAACLMTLLSDNKHYISIIAYKLGDVANIGAINHDKIHIFL
ncbi:MAG: TetR/AcrR family transcriptional regulator [Rikenellaceae bacterium]